MIKVNTTLFILNLIFIALILLLFVCWVILSSSLSGVKRQVQRRGTSASDSKPTIRVRCNICLTPQGQRTKWKIGQPSKIVAVGIIFWLSLLKNQFAKSEQKKTKSYRFNNKVNNKEQNNRKSLQQESFFG